MKSYEKYRERRIHQMTRIRLDQAVPMNGAQLETIEEAIRIRTHPASGGYSAFLPVEHALEDDGPAEFITAVEVLSGALSVAAVTHDMTILAERFCISVG